jgi:hypothetical protein
MKQPRKRRPFGVTLFSLLVLSFAVLNLLRLIQTIQKWDLLTVLLPFSPIYLLLSGLLWTVVGFPLAWGIWRGWRLAYLLSPVVLIVFSLYLWADRLLLSVYPERLDNWPFAAVLNILILAWSFWVLTRPKAKIFFGEKNESKPENQTPA